MRLTLFAKGLILLAIPLLFELGHYYARQHVEVSPGPFVLLAVTDTGTGIDESIRGKFFDPLFTTKEVGKGTGPGLATVYGIVKQSGGHVNVYSEVNRGTTFKVYLPRVEGRVAAEVGTLVPKAPTGSETILLAEDQDEVRGLARAALESHGYTVLEARHGKEALRLCEQHPGPIHLLITDLVMPQMGGRELVEQAGPRRPGLKVLYLSGYTDDAVLRHDLGEPGMMFLQKPFTPLSLARKVREALDR
jgi:CheY-like chemotaxis protein